MNHSRRDFIKSSSVLLGSLPLLSFERGIFEDKTIRVGLVGCGGRGNGAAVQALTADPHVKITALGDIFEDKLQQGLSLLSRKDANRVDVPENRQFVGFDSYRKVIDSGVDVVLLCAPPNFRPEHLDYAVRAGKHVFCEKPVAVDIPGLKKIMESIALSKTKSINVVSGFCFRYSKPNREIVSRIHQGDIGEVKSITTFRYGGEPTHKERQANWSELEYQLRNWYYYQRYASDMIVEQSIHSIDYMNWILGNKLPVSVSATGGRQSRPWDRLGNAYDHFAVEFDYGNGLKGVHFCRQQSGTEPRNSVEVIGTSGYSEVNIMRNYTIEGAKPYTYSDPINNMYQTQHDELFAAIRQGQVINDGDFMVNSTLLAIWAKLSAYSGQRLTLEQVMASEEELGPDSDSYHWEMEPDTLPIVRPGLKSFV
ncbi:Gfo/Idh/MocA family oxidoreductase [Parapedobacter sp. SGR-10]|uniref:Gfo/Idh/MocA family protein n=1 Tax=Parapedobacter sp. SGR-10 TaxID=2710879 RepID=UPI0013D192AC|nr:Gfo/Idh/MocA family oxidoreductase [Parapedobacter sp. SGR-10]NGF57065.1 Gfo/Idh/MocA family oxidoreductase [Parapedobacter sp. SGR-10]